jgi:hypothetical protein
VSKDFIYRDCHLPRLSKDNCCKFLQAVSIANASIRDSFQLANGFSGKDARYREMFFRLRFLDQADLEKFHAQGFATTKPEKISLQTVIE